MAGYEDTRQMIINTLTNRLTGTEIQPEDHQEFALAITDYVRSVELLSGNAFIGFAEANTTPVQSDKGQCFYISTVGPGQTVDFVNFIDYNGNAISVSSPGGKMSLVTLIWNTQYWSSQVTTIDTNWSIAQQSGDSESMVMSQKAVTDAIAEAINKLITTNRIEDGAITTEKIATSAFDSTLSVSGKIAPADVVGEKLAELDSVINGEKTEIDLTEDFIVGFYSDNGILFTNNTNWRCLSVDVSGGEKFLVKLKGTGNIGHTYSAIGYFVGSIFTRVKVSGEYVDFEGEYVVPTNATRVVFTTLFNDPSIVYYVKRVLQTRGLVDDVTENTNAIVAEVQRATSSESELNVEISRINSAISENVNLFENTLKGYFTKTGVWTPVSSENWKSTGRVNVSTGDRIIYKSVGNTLISSFGYWDSQDVFHDVSVMEDEIFVTEEMSAIQISSKSQEGDVFYATLSRIKDLWYDGKRIVTSFIPSIVPVVAGNDFRVFPYNTISVNKGDFSLDCWIENSQSSSPSMVSCENGMFIQGRGNGGSIIDHNNVILSWKLRNYDGSIKVLGTSTIISKTPINPLNKLYVLPIGDSITEFPVEGEQVEGFVGGNGLGAWVNEFSRLMNGNGDPIPNGGIDGNLSNVEVIGTRGTGTIKHEGRAGWSINNYMSRAAVGDVTNAFWNPSTSSFDLQYYMQNNGFTEVSVDGSNLVIVIFLNWNDVYSKTSEEFITIYNQFLSLIHTQMPQARVMILGMNCPPNKMNKNYSGNRIVTRLGVIEQCIRVENALKDIADTNISFVKHQPLLPFFCADGSYPTRTQRVNLRLSETELFYSDYVHPNLAGYGIIADIVYNSFCVNYL